MKEAVRHDTRPTTLSHMRADPEKRVADDRRMHGEADPAGEAGDDSAILHVGTEQAKLFARCFQPAHSLDRKSVVAGKGVSVRVVQGGRRFRKKKKKENNE